MDLNDIYLPLHLGVLLFVAWNTFRADHLGFDWIRGKKPMLNENEVHKYHTRVWIGLAGMIATGFLMFWPMREYLLERPQFLAKISFVLALIINGFVIGRLQKVSTTRKFTDLTLKEKLPLFISGAVSTISWISAAILAFFIVEDF